MGTSKDYSGGKGGAWTTTKRLASRIASDGPTRDRIQRYAESYVAALGGPAQATQSSAAARHTAAGVGAFFDSVRERGLTQTLEDLGLSEAVGKSPIELISLLADKLAGDGATLDENAARDALIDMLEDDFENLSDYTDLEAQAITDDGIRTKLANFLARFVFRKVLPLLATRLNKATADVVRRTEQDLDAYAKAACADAVRGIDVRRFNATGDAGRVLADEIVERAYTVFAT